MKPARFIRWVRLPWDVSGISRKKIKDFSEFGLASGRKPQVGSHAIGSTTYGNGLLLGNINSGGVVSNNLFEDEAVGKAPAIELEVPAGNDNFSSAATRPSLLPWR